MIGTGLIGAGLSAYQMYQGNQQSKQASNRLNSYKRNDLANPYENDQISTIGSDYAKERNDQMSADMIDASRNGGIRAIFGGLPKIQAMNNSAGQEGRQYLDGQVQQRQQNIAQDNVRTRDIREDRDYQNIAGMSSQQQAGEQNKWSAMMGFGKSAMSGWGGEKEEGSSGNGFKDPSVFSTMSVPSSVGWKPKQW
jgi:hypothetical protein